LEFFLMDAKTFDEFKKATSLQEQETARTKALINIGGPDMNRYYRFTREGYRYDFNVKVEETGSYYATLFNFQRTRGAKVRCKFSSPFFFPFFVEYEKPRIVETTKMIYATTTRPTTIEWTGTAVESRAGFDNPQTNLGILALIVGMAILGAAFLRKKPLEEAKPAMIAEAAPQAAAPAEAPSDELERELRLYEGYLERLEGMRDQISEEVYDSIKAEYEGRIRQLRERLGSRIA
jgi:hypothetical protein